MRSASITVYASSGGFFKGGDTGNEENLSTKKVNPTAVGVYPNPATNKVISSFALENDDTYTVGLYDLNGRVLKQLKKDNTDKGSIQTVEMDVNDVPNGIYVVRINGSVDHFSQRVVVNH